MNCPFELLYLFLSGRSININYIFSILSVCLLRMVYLLRNNNGYYQNIGGILQSVLFLLGGHN